MLQHIVFTSHVMQKQQNSKIERIINVHKPANICRRVVYRLLHEVNTTHRFKLTSLTTRSLTLILR